MPRRFAFFFGPRKYIWVNYGESMVNLWLMVNHGESLDNMIYPYLGVSENG